VRWREELREHQTSMAAERDRLERRAREAAAEWKAWNDREQAAGRASPELEAALALAAETVR
jgi:hypothetical protein